MRAFLASVAGLFVSVGLLHAAEPAVDYAKDVKPILAKNCYSCHGANKAKGKLRVDTLASMLKGGDSGPSVVPGKSKDSPLIHSLTGDGDIKRMPPKGGLSKNDIETLKKWVDAGAKADEKADVAAAPAANKPGERDRRRRGREGMRREMERKRELERKKDENKKDEDKKDDDKKEENKKKDDDRKKDDKKEDRKKNDKDD